MMNVKPRKLYTIKHPISFFQRYRRKYFQHECSFECSIEVEQNLIKENSNQFSVTNDSILKYQDNPFFIPIYFDYKRKDDCGKAVYLSPCGIELYSLEEIYNYLVKTNSKLCVNQFVMDPRIELFRYHKFFKVYVYKKDISEGNENSLIECINEINNELPKFNYIKNRILDTPIENDDSYSCTCLDDCRNKLECQCQKLTITESKILNIYDNVGYKYKFLPEIYLTAIYECNYKCSCKVNCLNRVVQNGLKVRLQLFKTKNRGWSVRTLHDIPKGTFISTYEGNLIENKSNFDSNKNYLMELNYLISLNKLVQLNNIFNKKPVEEQSNDDNIHLTDEDSIYLSDQELSSFSDITLSTSISSSSLSVNDKNDSLVETHTKLNKRFLEKSSPEKVKKFKTLELHLEQNKECCKFLIDGEHNGNISRFFNHSCNPNMAIQNIFIGSKNRNMPYPAFFTLKDVKAFKELTFSYLFDNHSELGFKCKCKSENCLSKKNKE